MFVLTNFWKPKKKKYLNDILKFRFQLKIFKLLNNKKKKKIIIIKEI
jgi:hypothetical protein